MRFIYLFVTLLCLLASSTVSSAAAAEKPIVPRVKSWAGCSASSKSKQTASAVEPVRFPQEVQHVHLVDSNASNTTWLFRGGDPNMGIQNNEFNYEGFKSSIIAAGKKSGVSLPSDFYIVDLNFLNFAEPNDVNHTMTEYLFFKNNPNLGEFHFWHSWGTHDNVSHPSFGANSTITKFFVSTFNEWMDDDIANRVEMMKTLLHSKAWNRPTVIYGHCDCGCDRTGQMFGAYYLGALNYSWSQTNKLNTEIAERPMGCQNYLLMQWYCLYLNTKDSADRDCLTNHPCTVQD